MVLSYHSPSWFYGYDVFLELSFAIVSLVVALFAFKIYKDTNSRFVKFFGIAFASISISYIIQSVLNFMIVTRLNENVCRFMKIQSVAMFENIGMLFHIFFFTIGVSILLYNTCKVKSLKLLWIFLIVSLGSIFLTANTLYMFYFMSTVYLSFLSYHFIKNYLKKKQGKILLVALAFVFLLFGHFHFLVAVNHQLFYVIGHILEFLAYIFIAINLYLVRKR